MKKDITIPEKYKSLIIESVSMYLDDLENDISRQELTNRTGVAHDDDYVLQDRLKELKAFLEG